MELKRPECADFVEKRHGECSIISHHDGWGTVDDGGKASPSGRVVLRVFARTSRAGGASAAVDRPVCRTRRGAVRAGAVLQRGGSALDRSGADDPDADRRLLLRHPLGAAVVRGGSLEPCLPLVLPARARWRGAGPLDVLEEPARPFPRERPVAQGVRDDRAPLHGRGFGWRRGVCGRCQHDQGRCQPAAQRAG
jgi:hypothetical protein